MGNRCAEQCHQPIAPILVNGALEAMNLCRDQLESPPHDFAEIFWIEPRADCRKSGDIAEQDCYLSPLALNGRMLGSNFVSQMSRYLNPKAD